MGIKSCQHLELQDTTKFTPSGIFRFENMPSGNPGAQHTSLISAQTNSEKVFFLQDLQLEENKRKAKKCTEFELRKAAYKAQGLKDLSPFRRNRPLMYFAHTKQFVSNSLLDYICIGSKQCNLPSLTPPTG
jgi:hypothetical protein